MKVVEVTKTQITRSYSYPQGRFTQLTWTTRIHIICIKKQCVHLNSRDSPDIVKSNILRNRPSLSHTISHIRLTNSDLNLGPCGYSFASRSEDCCLAFEQQPGSGVLSKNQKSYCSCFMDRLNSGNNFCCMCRRMNNNR